MTSARFHERSAAFEAGGVRLGGLSPLVDGKAPLAGPPRVSATDDGWRVDWLLESGERFELAVQKAQGGLILVCRLAFAGERRLASLGLRFGVTGNVQRYLRNGYMSWDGSYFVEPDAARTAAAADPSMLEGHAATALVSRQGDAAVIGFLRHDRFQSRLRFDFDRGPLAVEAETLLDGVSRSGSAETERLVLFADPDVEAALRRWARHVAAASPTAPRLRPRRITGWCSWYSLYASIDDGAIAEHLAAAREFRDATGTPLDVFLVDDGFTPEMGDWLKTRPTFPRGMKPVLDDIRSAGFVPGLWIAPFMVGNRSQLHAAHPDWVVRDRVTGRPLPAMTFYGEFRWHKRSEEYYVLDVTHPAAEAYIRGVFRKWSQDWGCGYFKTDFMHLGSRYGPETARWHQDGLSRMEIWMRMARLIREEIGEALWLACGSPIWAPVGLVDAVRIGRDIGVSWKGQQQSAESLLRDQTARNFAHGILWQADPDCILLRERFHELSDEQVRSLAIFAGLAGGVLMTSDHFGEMPPERRELFRYLAGDGASFACDYPMLGRASMRHEVGPAPEGRLKVVTEADPVVVQRVSRPAGVLLNVFNTGDLPVERLLPWALAGGAGECPVTEDGAAVAAANAGLYVTIAPHRSRQFLFARQ